MFYSEIIPINDSYYLCRQEDDTVSIVNEVGALVSTTYFSKEFRLSTKIREEVEGLWKVGPVLNYQFTTHGVIATTYRRGGYATGEGPNGTPIYDGIEFSFDFRNYYFPYDEEE